jgi:hypothetical protein
MPLDVHQCSRIVEVLDEVLSEQLEAQLASPLTRSRRITVAIPRDVTSFPPRYSSH